MLALTEHVDGLARDLEAFSAHAMRKTITPADVSLAARKQPLIVSKIAELCNAMDEGKKKRRKKGEGDL